MSTTDNKTHWLQSPNKNYLGHWDLPGGNDIVVTIQSAQWEEVKNPVINKSEAKRVVRFAEDVKPWICNQGNAQMIVRVTGIKFMEDSAGQKIILCVGKHLDRVSKENIDCIRVREEKPQRILISMDHKSIPKFEKAIEEGKTSIVKLQELYDFSDEALEQLKAVEIAASI